MHAYTTDHLKIVNQGAHIVILIFESVDIVSVSKSLLHACIRNMNSLLFQRNKSFLIYQRVKNLTKSFLVPLEP